TFQVLDLEGDPLVLRALRTEVGRTEIVTADAEVGVTIETADDREELRPLDGHRVVRETLLLRPRRHVRQVLHSERLLRGRALVGEYAHRDHCEDRGDHRDRPVERTALWALRG